ncbi:MAG: copZ [Rhodocyclales bacterium]|nr:copZ [Rhodocyclales bacterium]
MNASESMVEFRVEDMSCGHCVDTITKAIKAADPNAAVEINLQAHVVRVESELAAEDISAAIVDAGYTPVAAPPDTW